MKCAHESLYTLSKLMENTKTVQRLRSPDNWIRDRYFMKTRINNFYPRLPVGWQIIVAAGFEGYDADAEKTNGCRLKLSSLYFVMFGQWMRSKTSSAIDAEWVSEWEYKFRCAMVTSRMGTRAVTYVAIYVANIDPNVKSNSHVSRTHTFISEYEWEKTTYVYYNYYKSAWAEHTKTLFRLCCCTSYSKRFLHILFQTIHESRRYYVRLRLGWFPMYTNICQTECMQPNTWCTLTINMAITHGTRRKHSQLFDCCRGQHTKIKIEFVYTFRLRFVVFVVVFQLQSCGHHLFVFIVSIHCIRMRMRTVTVCGITWTQNYRVDDKVKTMSAKITLFCHFYGICFHYWRIISSRILWEAPCKIKNADNRWNGAQKKKLYTTNNTRIWKDNRDDQQWFWADFFFYLPVCL